MKRLIFAAIMFFSIATASATERMVSFNNLPQKAKTFISTHFAELTFSYAKYDTDITDHDYEVVFTDGTKIDFNRRGEWRKVECSRSTTMPQAILPQGIVEYIDSTHPNIKIEEVERERKGFQVSLTNDVEIVFDQRGRVKWYD